MLQDVNHVQGVGRPPQLIEVEAEEGVVGLQHHKVHQLHRKAEIIVW